MFAGNGRENFIIMDNLSCIIFKFKVYTHLARANFRTLRTFLCENFIIEENFLFTLIIITSGFPVIWPERTPRLFQVS